MYKQNQLGVIEELDTNCYKQRNSWLQLRLDFGIGTCLTTFLGGFDIFAIVQNKLFQEYLMTYIINEQCPSLATFALKTFNYFVEYNILS